MEFIYCIIYGHIHPTCNHFHMYISTYDMSYRGNPDAGAQGVHWLRKGDNSGQVNIFPRRITGVHVAEININETLLLLPEVHTVLKLLLLLYLCGQLSIVESQRQVDFAVVSTTCAPFRYMPQ